MNYTPADAAIAIALIAAFVAWMYFKHVERQRRIEIIHAERLAAMDKGIPLPELPLDPAHTAKPSDPREMLLHGVVWTALSCGAVVALVLIPNGIALWPLPLPLLFLGVGLILFYALGANRKR